MLRYFERSTVIGDTILGFHSAACERRRGLMMLVLMSVPLCHLGFFYVCPLQTTCCTGVPKVSIALNRLRTLSLLMLLLTFCLFGDAHCHGYFLLRITDHERCAIALLRRRLECDQPPPKADSLLGSCAEEAVEREHDRSLVSRMARSMCEILVLSTGAVAGAP